jgi:hypothetical protein
VNDELRSLTVRSLDEVAAVLGIPKESVRRIELQALAKLRRRLLATCGKELADCWPSCVRDSLHGPGGQLPSIPTGDSREEM